jgi:hypothetical protein
VRWTYSLCWLHSSSQPQLLLVSKALEEFIARPDAVRVSVGEVSEACHNRRIRHELSVPSAESSFYVRGLIAEVGGAYRELGTGGV